MKEPHQSYVYKTLQRNLLYIGAIITISVVVFQIFVLPYPLKKWSSSPLENVPKYKPLNSTRQLNEIQKEVGVEKVLGILDATQITSLNGSTETPRSVVLEPNNLEASGTRKTTVVKSYAQRTIIQEEKHSPPPSKRSDPSQLKRDTFSLPPNEALEYAKKEIEHAPLVNDDPDLYAPLFRNVSLFKRSYEMMEMILKVYIYREGKRPIFHHPHLKGIYASEGWFMKLIEANRQFITTDPEKAHLFYLPYSVRQLEVALHDPQSRDMKPLSIFLRNYVNMLAEKYPFWNRTHGSDHFLVACHDWGPYTVKEQKELHRNTIKALCNADLTEGVFVAGKDVSLPETTIRSPRRPLRNVGGGNRVSSRPILAFFAGNMHGRVRPTLLKYWRDKDEDMKIYGRLPLRVSQKMSYIQHMKSSKYCICPMGFEVNSPRIVEAIYYECVPVIIADNFVLPLSDVLNWSAFSVIVAEKDIPNLKEILMAITLKSYLTMQNNVKMVQKHFLWNARPVRYDLFHMVLHSIWYSRLQQTQTPKHSFCSFC